MLSAAEAEAAMPLPGNKLAIICIKYCHHDFALTSSKYYKCWLVMINKPYLIGANQKQPKNSIFS